MRGLFESLAHDGAAVRALVGRPEELDFDCKRKATPTQGAFEKEDKRSLGITLSAFANSMGGLLLWGVEARKDEDSGVDSVGGFEPITDLRRFESEARTISAEAVMPRIANVEFAAVEDPPNSGNGYLAMYVARSERRPQHCEIAGVRGYYRRSMASSRMMEHFEIEDAFKSSQVAELELNLRAYGSITYSDPRGSVATIGIEISMRNISNVSAMFPYIC